MTSQNLLKLSTSPGNWSLIYLQIQSNTIGMIVNNSDALLFHDPSSFCAAAARVSEKRRHAPFIVPWYLLGNFQSLISSRNVSYPTPHLFKRRMRCANSSPPTPWQRYTCDQSSVCMSSGLKLLRSVLSANSPWGLNPMPQSFCDCQNIYSSFFFLQQGGSCLAARQRSPIELRSCYARSRGAL